MRPLSSSPLSSSSVPPTSSVSFFERYEKMFNGCGGCVADDEQEPVASAIYQQSSCETDVQQQSTQPNEAISNYWSSSNHKAQRRHQQESPPVETTVLLNQPTSYDDIDKFDIEERTSKRQQSKTTQAAKTKAKTEATAVNEYFTGRRNSHQPESHMAIQRSPTTMMTPQQQRRQQQQHCHHVTPITSITNVLPFSPKTSKQPLSSPPKTRLQQYDMFQVVMPRSFRSVQGSTGPQHRHEGNLKYIDSDSTQSTQSLSESDDDLSWGLEENEEQPQQLQEQDTTPVSILRSKFMSETRTETTRTEKNRVRRVVRFEQETKFPDHTEVLSSTRKQVPRMSPQQKQEYMSMYMVHTSYPPTTTDRRRQRQRQWEVSSFLMEPAAAVGPSPLVRAPTPNNQDEFRDSSLTATKNSPTYNMNGMCSSSSHPERLARRAQQNQYHHPHHHHQRSHSSTSEELSLSHYYTNNQNNDELASYFAFQ